ncbi:restriction endonuclease subunit S [Acinetobacter sp. WCHAc010034]|uniref:restriction endonuclease subunit S n=2 Tax=Acinetobacter TaxID=469 RepID=UPI00083B09FC|nr:restriction endonuclease subunit S [Acinetobacter sp. WCHAc010034]AYA03962.1 restriction endonuclease subunit S [Acinetobacter sp. WCHAc010034]
MMAQSNLTFTEKHDVPEGYKKTEVGVIPNDWNVESLQNLCRSSITYGIVQCGPHIPNGVPYIRVSDMNSSELNVDEMLRTSPEIASSFGRSKVEEGDIVYALRGKLGEVKMVGTAVSGANLTQGTARIAPKNNIDNRYLLWTLRSPQALKQAVKEAKGSTFVEITLGNLKGIGVPLPSSREEQEKIATALSDTDALISEFEKLIEKKQAIKTATMQQLLTGKTRLPEFALREDGTPKGYKGSELGQIPEDWEVDKIRNTLSITTGSRNTQDKVNDGAYPFFVRSQNVERINTYSFDGEGVLTAGDGVGTGKIFHYINGKCDIHQRVYLMSDFKQTLDGYYFYIFFSNYFYDRIMSMTAKSSVDSVRREMIADMLIFLPSINEQKKIASVIKNLFEEIEVLNIKLNKLLKIKQGMMQELLTGKTRLV